MTQPALPSSDQIAACAFQRVMTDPSFKIGAANIRGNEYRVFENAPASLVGIFEAGLAHGDRPFLYYEDEVWSHKRLYAESRKCAHVLATRFGVGKGDRVAIAMRNFPEWCAVFMGAVSLGAVVVPLNAWWTSEELRYGLKDCGAKLVFVDDKRLAALVPLKAALSLTLIAVRAKDAGADHDYEKLIAGADEMEANWSIAPEDDFAIYYTSGSTGNPKGVILTHRGAVTTLYSWYLITTSVTDANGGVPLHGDNPGVILGIPLFHVTGSHAIFLLSWIIGRRVAMMPKWDARAAIAIINRWRLTNFVGVPSQSYELIEASADQPTPSLIDIGSGGAKRPPEHVRLLKQRFASANPSSGYGLTETNASGCIISLLDYASRPDSTGRALPPCCDIKIVGEKGDCATGEVGEIWIRTAANFRGYLNLPEDTARALTHDGWFKSGDLGKIDAEGFVYVVDRLKDLIIRGGENISCLEVEARAYQHPGVDQAIVFSTPDETLGERVGMVVYPKQGSNLDPRALRDFMALELAKFKCPERIWISPQPLPKLGTEKFDKQLIRRLALQHPPAFSA